MSGDEARDMRDTEDQAGEPQADLSDLTLFESENPLADLDPSTLTVEGEGDPSDLDPSTLTVEGEGDPSDLDPSTLTVEGEGDPSDLDPSTLTVEGEGDPSGILVRKCDASYDASLKSHYEADGGSMFRCTKPLGHDRKPSEMFIYPRDANRYFPEGEERYFLIPVDGPSGNTSLANPEEEVRKVIFRLSGEFGPQILETFRHGLAEAEDFYNSILEGPPLPADEVYRLASIEKAHKLRKSRR